MILRSLIWDRIGNEWLVGKTASILFGISAIIIIAMTPIWFGLMVIPDATWWGDLLLAIFGVISTIGGFFLWLGMWRHWAKCNQSKPIIKRLWFLILIFGLWYGAIAYYILAYLNSVRQRKHLINEGLNEGI